MTFIAAFLALPRTVKLCLTLLVGTFLLCIAALIWLRSHDKSVVRKYETEVTASVVQTALQAERTATRNDEARQVVRERQVDQLEQAREDAIHENPEAASIMAGPAVSAVLAELRRQASEDRNTKR